MKKSVYIIAVMFLFALTAKGQDQHHMSQYMMHQPFVNPAAISSYENLNGALFYRHQWAGFDGAPRVQGLNVNSPVFNDKSAVGLTVIHDQIGVNRDIDISGTYAYKVQVSDESHLGFGLSATLKMMESRLSDAKVNDVEDPVFAGNTDMYMMPNFQFGTYYFNSDFYIGLASPNLLQNTLTDGSTVEPKTYFNFEAIHFYLHSGYRFGISDDLDLNTSVFVKEVAGAPVQFDINGQVLYKKKLGVGVSYRTFNEIVGLANFRITDDIKVGYAYDFNLSELNNYSSGSHEIMLIYAPAGKEEATIITPRF